MDNGPLDAIIAEGEAAVHSLSDPIEGLIDFAALNITDQAKASVATAKGEYDSYLAAINLVLIDSHKLHDSITALLNKGYPIPPSLDVIEDIVANLAAQIRTENAALKIFKAIPLTTNVAGKIGPERPSK